MAPVSFSINGSAAAMVEVGCETDFVARTDEFLGLGNELATVAAAEYPAHAGQAPGARPPVVAGAGVSHRLQPEGPFQVAESAVVNHVGNAREGG